MVQGVSGIFLVVVAVVHTVVEPLYAPRDGQPNSPLWILLDPLMIAVVAVGVIFAWLRKRTASSQRAGDAVTRAWLAASTWFYGLRVNLLSHRLRWKCAMRRILGGRYGPTVVQLVLIGILTLIGLRFAWAEAIGNQPHIEVSIVRTEVPRTGLFEYFRTSLEVLQETGFPAPLLEQIRSVTDSIPEYETRADLIRTLRAIGNVQLELQAQDSPTDATQDYIRAVSELSSGALQRYFTNRRVTVTTNIENHSRVPTTILRNAVLLIANSKNSWITVDVLLGDDLVLGGGHARRVSFVSETLGNIGRAEFQFVDSQFGETSLCALVIVDIREHEWWTALSMCAEGELSDRGLAQKLHAKHRSEVEKHDP